jgi:hypothetical protein
VLDVDSSTGAAVVAVPIPVTAARAGFGPSVSLSCDSRAANSLFGVGWTLNWGPAVTLATLDSRRVTTPATGTRTRLEAIEAVVPDFHRQRSASLVRGMRTTEGEQTGHGCTGK